ncbi:MAG: Glucose-6-phosphate dehydrogenase assembly protein OpcA, contains a peptidoglycan-binding domain [Verrucomicrobia bacterium]|nr:MAG: Glucose-6-phosphate dehydrogenase assembly protein OpcA, contains a peptidoglycan-binding domain [Verrucomicrobiota bacterium]
MEVTIPAPLRVAIDDGLFGEETPLGEIDLRLDKYFSVEPGVTRASLMNLAIYTEHPESLADDDESLNRITRNHACRALLLGVLPDLGGLSVRCWIKARCQLGPDAKGKLCSEQVTFLLGGDCQSCLTNLVFCHLRSDLPLVMWWRGELSHHFQESLYTLIDRLILDSSRWANPVPQFAKIAQAVTAPTGRLSDRRGQLLVHDLAYTRGHQHRRAVAVLFDPPAARQFLPEINRIEIVHTPTHRHTGLYLAAWITRQLGAELVQRVGAAYHYERPGGARISLSLLEQNRGTSAIPSILLEGGGARFEVIASEASLLLEIRSRFGVHQTSSFLPGPSQGDEDLVNEILMRGGSNLLLAQVLPRMAAML